jgi:hypothetical protein
MQNKQGPQHWGCYVGDKVHDMTARQSLGDTPAATKYM